MSTRKKPGNRLYRKSVSQLVISLTFEIVFDARLSQEAANTEWKAAQLQEALAWRLLTAQQQRQIAAAPKPYAGQKINCVVYFSELEAWVFADQIEAALRYKISGIGLRGGMYTLGRSFCRHALRRGC
jgi:hypothetical protein